MSTNLYLVCLEHIPFIESDNVEHHISIEIIDKIRSWVNDRDFYIKAYEVAEFTDPDFGSGYQNTAARFMLGHKKCRLALTTEYGEWIDLGMGLLPDVKIWEPPKPREPKTPKPRLVKEFNADVMTKLEEIRERDKEAIPRFFGANWQDNILLQAEMDRRYLLSLFEE